MWQEPNIVRRPVRPLASAQRCVVVAGVLLVGMGFDTGLSGWGDAQPDLSVVRLMTQAKSLRRWTIADQPGHTRGEVAFARDRATSLPQDFREDADCPKLWPQSPAPVTEGLHEDYSSQIRLDVRRWRLATWGAVRGAARADRRQASGLMSSLPRLAYSSLSLRKLLCIWVI